MKITKKSIRDHITALRKKEYCAVELCSAYLDEIRKRDAETCHAYVAVDPKKAIMQAEQADKMLAECNAPLLCGIPYGAKDNICTRGITTSAGSKMLESYVPPYDATVIKRLKEKGSVLLGKTNMDEFAMGSTTETGIFGASANPEDLKMTPGGSSGGSAAAVSAELAPFALGSDTGGSVRQPAAFCGCVGLCPTYGALSRYGLIAFASSLDRIGILTRTCADNAIVFSSLLGKDPLDATSVDHSISLCAKGNVKGLRIGIAAEFFSDTIPAKTKEAVLSAAEKFKSIGAETVSVSLPSLKYVTECYYIISSAEASSNLARYDGIRFGHRSEKSVSSMDGFYKANRSEGFGNEVKRRIMLGTFVLSEGSYENYYKKALFVRELIKEDYKKAFEKCDLIISPVSPGTAFPLGEERSDPTKLYLEDLCTVSQSLAGLPALSLPCQKGENGLPIGMQLTAPAFRETLLYQAGIAYEELMI